MRMYEGKSLSISFVLPMFNEKDNIETTVGKLQNLAGELTDDYELVVVDDASTDGCSDIAEKMAVEDKRIKLFRLKENSKFGGAFAAGFKNSTKHVIVYTDSDMPVSRDDILKSFPLIEEYDIVTGCSKIRKGDSLRRKAISGVYNLLVQTLFGLNVKDINSGYKIVRRDLIKDLRFFSKSPFVDVELFIHAKRKGGRIKQFPVIFNSREGGISHISHMSFILATFIDMIKVKVLCSRRRIK